MFGALKDNELVLEKAFDAFGESLFHLVGHVFFGAAHPPDLPLMQVPNTLEIDVGLVEDDDLTRGNTRKDFACPPVVYLARYPCGMPVNREQKTLGCTRARV